MLARRLSRCSFVPSLAPASEGSRRWIRTKSPPVQDSGKKWPMIPSTHSPKIYMSVSIYIRVACIYMHVHISRQGIPREATVCVCGAYMVCNCLPNSQERGTKMCARLSRIEMEIHDAIISNNHTVTTIERPECYYDGAASALLE